MGAAAVLGAVIVLAVLLVVRELRGSDEETGATDTSIAASSGTAPGELLTPPRPPSGAGEEEGPTTGAGPGGAVEVVACPAGLDAAICDAAEFVQLTRGRPFRTFPTVEILDTAEFDQAVVEGFEDYRPGLEADDVLLKAIGLLDPERSMVDAFLEALELGVVGVYDPRTGRMVVRGSELSLFAQQVLVHELTHALDDQWFDLDRGTFADHDADYAFNAVIEGNARRVEQQWRAQLDATDGAELQQQELDALSIEELQRYLELPPVVRQLLLSPYVDGTAFVGARLDAGGEAAIDEALTSPPTSSEEILHPELDRAAEPEVVVDPPPPGGAMVEQGRLGELVLRLWLGRLAGEGWGGDRYVTWVGPSGASCISVDVVADTAEDLIDIETTAEGWVRAETDRRSVEPTTSDGRPAVRLSGCAGP